MHFFSILIILPPGQSFWNTKLIAVFFKKPLILKIHSSPWLYFDSIWSQIKKNKRTRFLVWSTGFIVLGQIACNQLSVYSIFTSPPIGGGARYCNAHVCVFVCVCVCLFVCPCFRKISKCNISAISQPITMKFGTHTGGAAGEVCHLWLPC